MQWLDDLDDLVIAIVHSVERLRWPCLQIGFGAAVALALATNANAAQAWLAALTWTAIASLLLWASAIALAGLPETRARAPRSPNNA